MPPKSKKATSERDEALPLTAAGPISAEGSLAAEPLAAGPAESELITEKPKAPRERKPLSWKTERAYWKRGVFTIVGVDEAGRGPLAGPVVASAVYFDYERCSNFPKSLRDLNDSKQLLAEERERFYGLILKHAKAVGVGVVSAKEIDELNILQATMKAMSLAVDEVAQKLAEDNIVPEMLLVDGNYFRTSLPYEYQTVIDGDAKSPLIAAASIIAKVTRDRMMIQLHEIYPQYGFASHKGYSVPEHLRALKQHGPCPEHRRSFRRGMYNQEELIFETVTSDEELLNAEPLPDQTSLNESLIDEPSMDYDTGPA